MGGYTPVARLPSIEFCVVRIMLCAMFMYGRYPGKAHSAARSVQDSSGWVQDNQMPSEMAHLSGLNFILQ